MNGLMHASLVSVSGSKLLKRNHGIERVTLFPHNVHHGGECYWHDDKTLAGKGLNPTSLGLWWDVPGRGSQVDRDRQWRQIRLHYMLHCCNEENTIYILASGIDTM